MRSMRFVLTRVQLIIAAAIAITAIGVTTAASAQTVSGNGTGTNNGFYYSLYSSGGSATMTLGTAGNYAITWSGVSDVISLSLSLSLSLSPPPPPPPPPPPAAAQPLSPASRRAPRTAHG